MSAGASRLPGPSRPQTSAHRIAVAASGGLDSTALLHCVHAIAARVGVQVHALHVNHGLHADAGRWQAQVERQCRRWAGGRGTLVFAAARLSGAPGKGESVEAWARRERYAALAQLAREAGCGIVLLAHHRRDQAETVLLQALRGAGPAGLAAMPRVAERGGLLWLRPWLDQPRERIEAYARCWRLSHVRDPANEADRYARNRVRNSVLPVMREAFADAEQVLCHVAHRAQEAAQVLAEVAGIDAGAAIDERGALVVSRWLALSEARRANLLRRWLVDAAGSTGPDTLVARLLQELPVARSARWPVASGTELRLHGGRLFAFAQSSHHAPPAGGAGSIATLDLSRPGCYAASPWHGVLRVDPGDASGLPAALLQSAELRARRGGEQFQSHPSSPPRSLKKQFQSAGIDAWSRDAPLVYAGSQLLFVPGLGADARALALPGAPRLRLSWTP